MLRNQTKLLQGESLRGTYPIPRPVLLGFLSRHKVDLSIGEVLLPLRTLLLISSLGVLPIGTVLSHVA
jgi:hypothetical protein